MGFLVVYKGNQGGSVTIPDSEFEAIKPASAVFSCPLCEEIFESQELLQDHKIAAHPLKRPYLVIHGSAVGSDAVCMKKRLERGDLGVENAEQTYLDGELFDDPDKMLATLVANQSGRRVVTLSYQSYQVEVGLTFDLISDAALKLVEEYFQDVFSAQELSAEKLRQFDSKLQEAHCGNTYAGGLGCYVSGIMAKDRVRSSGLAFEQFNEKFGEALDALESIDTELSKSIKAAILFSRNQFVRSMNATFLPQLSAAAQFMTSGEFRDVEVETVPRSVLLPIDSVTDSVVMFCTRGATYRQSAAESLLGISKTSSISLEDRDKINFALMCHNLELSMIDKAKGYFRKVRHSVAFKEVAVNIMGLSDGN